MNILWLINSRTICKYVVTYIIFTSIMSIKPQSLFVVASVQYFSAEGLLISALVYTAALLNFGLTM